MPLPDRALSWDEEPIPASEFSEGGGEYVVLPPGEYDFEVVKFERVKHVPKDGRGKLPPCPKCVITLVIESDYGTSIVKHNLFLHTKTIGMIADFFRCVGLRKHGDDLAFAWDDLPGSTGRCKIKNRQYNDNTYNEVDRFLDPPETPEAEQEECPF